MPAGYYVISHVQGERLWRIRTPGHAIFLTSRPRQLKHVPDTSVLIFDHDANGYTLRQFQQQAENEAAEVGKPSRTIERPQQIATVTALPR